MFIKSVKKIKINQNMSELWYSVCKNIILTLVHLLVLSCDLFIKAGPWITTRWVNWRWWASDWLLHSFPGTDRLSKYYAIHTLPIRHISYSLVYFFSPTSLTPGCRGSATSARQVTQARSLPATCNFFFFGAFAKLKKRLLASSSPSLPPRGTAGLPWVRFSWNLIFEHFSTICGENSSFIEIGQEWRVFYMKTKIHFWSYFA